MTYMIASDIHGSAYYCRLLLDRFHAAKADRLILLGDLLYHGPRNALPRDYDPKDVITQLNGIADRLLCVRGNCDCDVDQMVLQFPIMAEYAVLAEGGRLFYLTHGHRVAQTLPHFASRRDILLHGHTHIPTCEEREDCLEVNPGSVSIPKENSPHSCILLSGTDLDWIDLESGDSYRHFVLT